MKRLYLAVAIGGMLGASLREWFELIIPTAASFPLGTWIINVTGSFLLAFLYAYTARIIRFPQWLRVGIGTGLLGAYTTFSTFCVETVTLMQHGAFFVALSYLIISLIGGILFAVMGHFIANHIPVSKEKVVKS